VLTKEGPLTDEEYHHIQSHPGYTKSILEKINFSRELRNVPLIAAAHHEKLDGSGYPSGLSNNEIPDMGKILAVADVVDALTSKRHYRDRMDFHKVMGILTEESGSHFDEFFVNAFKKINIGVLISILEDENRNFLDDNDLQFLSKFDIWDLIEGLESESLSNEQCQLVERFNHYYNRTYLKR
jgi:HD-GYP domain-containing protein (c-di-GMP phosphodiesterase class II)